MKRAEFIFLVMFVAGLPRGVEGQDRPPPKRLAPPVAEGPFLRPAAGAAAEPSWGIKGGIAVGLWPTRGPRGLIRVYAPYLGRDRLAPLNFIAVEPVARGSRGLSELERSSLDRVEGKAMWTGDIRDDDPRPRPPWQPARGVVTTTRGVRTLAFFVFVEPFENGARPVVEVRLREDRPYEVGFRVFAARGGAVMNWCVLTATMGNYARLRRLWLRDRVEEAGVVYKPFRATFMGFADHRQWGADRLRVVDGEALVAATTNEAEPTRAAYGKDVPPWWHYQGAKATQYWRTRFRDDLVVRVNGRAIYWGTSAAIPGGVAYENFELEAPFTPGQKFRFGVTPDTPERLGFQGK
jgi:hypothetical protein